MSLAITGSVILNIALANALGSIYARQSQNIAPVSIQQTFNIAGNELLTATGFPVPPSGVTIGLPNNPTLANITAVELSGNIATYTAVNAFEPGMNVTITGATSNGIYNVANEVILSANGTSFTLGITNGNLPETGETAAIATVGGLSLLYIRNTGNGTVNVTWTPSGGVSAVVLPLPEQAELNLAFPLGSAGISALSLASTVVAAAQVSQVTLIGNVLTYTTTNTNGFILGQLLTATGLASLYNVTGLRIQSIVSPTSFTVLAPGEVFPLTQATFSGGSVTYTGTMAPGASNGLVGATFNVNGFTNPGNNGQFVVTASTTTTLVAVNAAGVNETNPATASLYSVGLVDTLTQATVSGGSVIYTGTIPGGAANALVGYTFNIAGFTNAGNDGVFVITASSATTLTAVNAAGVNETHAATATQVGVAPGNALVTTPGASVEYAILG